MKAFRANGTGPRVLVIGTGAVGSLYGGMLAQAGSHVSVVCKSAFETVRDQGIRVDSIWGDFAWFPAETVARSGDYSGEADYLLVCLKVLPEIDTAALIRPALAPGTRVVLIQNGVDIEPPLAERLPGNEIISGLAFVCCNRLAPGHFHHLDYGRLVLGTWPEGISAGVEELHGLFGQTPVPCEVSDDIVRDRWIKLVWNAAFNPLSVLCGGITTRAILDDPVSARLARQIMTDVCRLATALEHPLGEAVIQKNMDDTEAMEPYKTSMLLDYEAGRPMEVEAILGNAVRLAEQREIEVPYLLSLYGTLRHVDRQNRRR